MSDKAIVTPDVLRWARKTAKMTLEKAASSIGCSPDRLQSWEDGDDQPTIKQAQKLAHVYHRPFALLFLPEPPKDFKPLQDFRSNKQGEFSTALTFMMREVQEKQSWVRTTFEENEERPLDFVGKFNRRTSPETVANDIRETLGIHSFDHRDTSALKYWISKAESARIFVSISSNFHSKAKLDTEEVKGFAIADRFAPFVFLNSDDYENPQLFTLAHELAHIWINQSGISVDTQMVSFRGAHNHKIDPVEIFCNKVAANALLPKDAMVSAGKIYDLTKFDKVEQIARRYGVSNITLLFRLHELEIINRRQFGGLKKIADLRFEAYERNQAETEKKSGDVNYYILQVRRNGKAFSQLVLDFYRGGQITGVEASHLLRVKLSNFPNLEQYVYK